MKKLKEFNIDIITDMKKDKILKFIINDSIIIKFGDTPHQKLGKLQKFYIDIK